jgi:hypothetical protein
LLRAHGIRKVDEDADIDAQKRRYQHDEVVRLKLATGVRPGGQEPIVALVAVIGEDGQHEAEVYSVVTCVEDLRGLVGESGSGSLGETVAAGGLVLDCLAGLGDAGEDVV